MQGRQVGKVICMEKIEEHADGGEKEVRGEYRGKTRVSGLGFSHFGKPLAAAEGGGINDGRPEKERSDFRSSTRER